MVNNEEEGESQYQRYRRYDELKIEGVEMSNSSTKVRICLEMKGPRLITISPDDTVEAAIRKLVDNKIGAMPVCDGKGNLIGIISERDLLRECAQRAKSINKTRVKDIMTRDPITVHLDFSIEETSRVFLKNKISKWNLKIYFQKNST